MGRINAEDYGVNTLLNYMRQTLLAIAVKCGDFSDDHDLLEENHNFDEKIDDNCFTRALKYESVDFIASIIVKTFCVIHILYIILKNAESLNAWMKNLKSLNVKLHSKILLKYLLSISTTYYCKKQKNILSKKAFLSSVLIFCLYRLLMDINNLESTVHKFLYLYTFFFMNVFKQWDFIFSAGDIESISFKDYLRFNFSSFTLYSDYLRYKIKKHSNYIAYASIFFFSWSSNLYLSVYFLIIQ